MNRIIALTLLLVALTTSSVAAAENESSATPFADAAATLAVPASIAIDLNEKRPAILPTLYVTFAAMQALDIYSTTAALKAGARETNPLAAPFVGNPASMIGLKLMSTASTIYYAERMWKTNRTKAVVVLAAINGAMAMVSVHNMRQVRAASARR